MFSLFRRNNMSLTLEEALEVVKAQYDKKSRSRRWFTTPIRYLAGIIYLEQQGVAFGADVFPLVMGMDGGEGMSTPITDVTAVHLECWETFIEKSPNARNGKQRGWHTIDSYKRAMRAFWNHLIRMRHLKGPGPHAELSFEVLPTLEPRHLTEDELRRLKEAAARSVRDRAMFEVLRSSGCRIGGLVSMRVSTLVISETAVSPDDLPSPLCDVIKLADENNVGFLIDPIYRLQMVGEFEVVEKGKHGRKQHLWKFLDHDACTAVREYLGTRPVDAPDHLWLAQSSGRAISANGIYAAFKEVTDVAGVDCSPHDLRHTFAHKILYEDGVDLRTAADLLGHSDPMTTLRIYHKNRKSDLLNKHREIHSPIRHLKLK